MRSMRRKRSERSWPSECSKYLGREVEGRGGEVVYAEQQRSPLARDGAAVRHAVRVGVRASVLNSSRVGLSSSTLALTLALTEAAAGLLPLLCLSSSRAGP